MWQIMWSWTVFINYENFKYQKRLIDKWVADCSENIDGNKMIYKIL